MIWYYFLVVFDKKDDFCCFVFAAQFPKKENKKENRQYESDIRNISFYACNLLSQSIDVRSSVEWKVNEYLDDIHATFFHSKFVI